MSQVYCKTCGKSVDRSNLIKDTVDSVELIYCPVCRSVLSAKIPANVYADYLPTVDQINYTIHCLQKQEAKVTNALKQLHETITKLDILREMSKEKEIPYAD